MFALIPCFSPHRRWKSGWPEPATVSCCQSIQSESSQSLCQYPGSVQEVLCSLWIHLFTCLFTFFYYITCIFWGQCSRQPKRYNAWLQVDKETECVRVETIFVKDSWFLLGLWTKFWSVNLDGPHPLWTIDVVLLASFVTCFLWKLTLVCAAVYLKKKEKYDDNNDRTFSYLLHYVQSPLTFS